MHHFIVSLLAENEEKVKPEHMKKKDRKVMRQSKDNTNYELAVKAKSLWNELRRMDLKNERRVELSNQLYAMIKGKTQKVETAALFCTYVNFNLICPNIITLFAFFF